MIKQATSLQEVKALPVTHAENFPVASWLCPPHLRPAIAAIYAFARAADDMADEGEQGPAQRLEALQDFRQELIHGPSLECAHPEIFIPLHQVIQSFNLPVQYLNDLLKAFEQDVQATAQASKPKSIEELLQYCQLSANPVGRLLLHLYGVNDDEALRRSDAICSALQLINFWQDLSVDVPRGRLYLPPGALVSDELVFARHLMEQGAPLVRRLPGRFGWELRLVVQGGLRILDKIESTDTRLHRPRLRAMDIVTMLWRSIWMRSGQ